MANPFWDFSLERYGADGVAPACLLLQDDFGLDVNLLLYAAWLAHRGQRLSEAHLEALERLVAEWREGVVSPLRALCRELRRYPAAATLREELKRLELQAERHQQDLMYGYYRTAPALPRDGEALSANLSRVARRNHPPDGAWRAPLADLAALLDR